jgi:tRNA nucleotidyltransferase (CCA-adding enzyme)
VLEIAAALQGAGKRAWIVGGCVRDLLVGRAVGDWDICTDALPDEMMKVFPRAIPTGIAHGTLTVVKNKAHYEVTTLRGETTYSDGRRPDHVFFVDDITRDLARRDFTINAMALDPDTGELFDPFDGRGDLQRKVVRAVGNPDERFAEDGLRVLRAARFAAQLEFEVEPATEQAITHNLTTYRKVSAERVRDEWMKTMKAKRPSLAFDIMRRSGILAVSCPELMEGVGVEQNRYHTYDVWGHALACMDACEGDAVLRIAALLHDVGKPRSRAFSDKTQDYTFYEHERIGAEMVRPLCLRLRFSTDECQRIEDLVRHHMWHYDEWTDAAVRRWVKRVGLHRIDDLYALRRADVAGKGQGKVVPTDLDSLEALRAHVERVLSAGAALTVRDLKINGHDLMRDLGLAPGRQLGEILNQLLEVVLNDPEENDRGRLMDRARALAKG